MGLNVTGFFHVDNVFTSFHLHPSSNFMDFSSGHFSNLPDISWILIWLFRTCDWNEMSVEWWMLIVHTAEYRPSVRESGCCPCPRNINFWTLPNVELSSDMKGCHLDHPHRANGSKPVFPGILVSKIAKEQRLAPKNFGFQHQGASTGAPPRRPNAFSTKSTGALGGDPHRGPLNSRNCRFSELVKFDIEPFLWPVKIALFGSRMGFFFFRQWATP